MIRLPFQGGWGFMLASAGFVILSSRRLLGKMRWLRWSCLALAAGLMVISLTAARMRVTPQVTVMGAGYHTAVLVEDAGESAMIAGGEVYGAEDMVQAGYHGQTDTLVFTGNCLTDLEETLRESEKVKRVVLRKDYADLFPGWVDAVLQRHGAEGIFLNEGEPLALGSFTMEFQKKGLKLVKAGWSMNCGGEAREREVYVVEYASVGSLKKAQGAAEIIYAQPYSQRGLDEPVTNGYNTIRNGAWVKRWP